MGNEAIALGAIEAGVQVATGYPGTPSTEALETIIRYASMYGIYTEWSSNEKVALETAVGAAYSGAKALVTMKQVGLNVASDPLMSLSYIGVKGALVLLVADDPGPHSSQTEQDTRVFGHFANIPVLDPATPQEAYELTKLAFELSHEFEIPVILRTTTRVSHSCGDVDLAVSEPFQVEAACEGFTKDRRWTIFPRLTAERHPWLENTQVKFSERFSELSFNSVSGNGKIGIITSGVSALYAKEAIRGFEKLFTIFRVGTVYPFPEKAGLSFLKGIDRLIAIEELDPYLEEQVLQLIGRTHLPVDVYGKKNGFFPVNGEYSVDIVIEGINRVLADLGENSIISHASSVVLREELPLLPIRAPTLCAGCMHRTVFYAFKQAAKQFKKDSQIDTIFSGDIGCYTLGNAHPLNMVDTCLCMGAGMSIAGGLSRTNPEAKHVAFIGDSTFFHSGIPAVINAVYNGADVTLAVLDNRTTAMTGHQPHPGLGVTALGRASKPIDIADVVRSCGVEFVRKVNIDSFENDLQNTLKSMENSLESCIEAAKEAMEFQGPSVVVFEGKCVGITKPDKRYTIEPEKCTGCGFCVKQLGCPALFLPAGEDKPVVQDSCSGCGLCAQVCPSGAINVQGVRL
jgi:indolepyruvate ferredoxin oxidoreductase alpha subunit